MEKTEKRNDPLVDFAEKVGQIEAEQTWIKKTLDNFFDLLDKHMAEEEVRIKKQDRLITGVLILLVLTYLEQVSPGISKQIISYLAIFIPFV